MKEDRPVRCEDCRHARLVQYATDPVIAYCRYSRYGEIAAKERRCSRYENNNLAPSEAKKDTTLCR